MLVGVAAATMLSLPCLDCGPVVRTEYGPVQGRRQGSAVAYHSIPFAAPPTGARRWKLPEPPAPWNQTLQATRHHSCPQLDLVQGLRIGEEDCLYMSVYVPGTCTSEAPCGVMQWIHGGAWIAGSNYHNGLFDGVTLAERYGVVIVAANYRLDSLGWLALAELADAEGALGNYGLHDQQLALQWTQRNIPAFGGDPQRVTLFGESAGGFSVCQHLVSPASDRLFSSAIIESADCDGPWNIFPAQPAQVFGDAFATAIGCPPGAGRLACLRALPLDEAMMPYGEEWLCPRSEAEPNATTPPPNPWCNTTGLPTVAPAAAAAWDRRQIERAARLDAVVKEARASGGGASGSRWPALRPPMAPLVGFAAVVDGSEQGLPDTPYRLLQRGTMNRSPSGAPLSVVLGTNRDEFALFFATLPYIFPGVKLPFRGKDLDLIAAHLASYHDHWGDAEAARIVAAYPRAHYATGNLQIVRLATDLCFKCGTRNAARALAAAGIATYLYSFEFEDDGYKDPGSLRCALNDEVGCGVAHADELKYVWQRTRGGRASAVDALFGGFWTNVAKTGSPNGPGLPQWPRYSSEGYRHLVIADPPAVVSDDYRNATCNFWDTMPKEDPYV